MATLQQTRPATKLSVSHLALISGLIWFLGCAWIVFEPTTVGSPDEAANAHFIERVADTGEVIDNQSTIQLTASQLTYWHPRSVRVESQTLKPMSFVGLVVVGGWLDRLTFDGFHRLLTPFLAVFGLFALYKILRRFWSSSWALLGASLVAFHPIWFQFQTLPYYHNGAFAALLVVAGWRLMQLWDSRHLRDAVWFGCAYGAALFFRPVEVLWTAPLIAIVLLAQRQWRALGVAIVVTSILQLPWLMMNLSLYGSIFSTGYATGGIGQLIESSVETELATPRVITPPGGWSWNWIHSFWNYLFLMVPAWGFAVGLAFLHYLHRIRTNPLKVFKIGLVMLSTVFVIVYYGSWNLYPLETPSAVGSLASYARYWIPLYVPMVVGVLWLLKRITPQRFFLLVAILALFASQLVPIIWHPSAGLLARWNQDQSQVEKKEQVLQKTPAGSAIIAGHMDKVLFPDRTVSFGLPQNSQEWEALQSLSLSRSVYLYVTPRQYSQTRVDLQLAPYGLQIGEIQTIGSDQLWEIRS